MDDDDFAGLLDGPTLSDMVRSGVVPTRNTVTQPSRNAVVVNVDADDDDDDDEEQLQILMDTLDAEDEHASTSEDEDSADDADSIQEDDLVAELLQRCQPGQPIEVTVPSPKSLTVQLLPHQTEALQWMCARESGAGGEGSMGEVRGGILADPMGLGKTVMMMALCEARRTRLKDHITLGKIKSDATLVICPLSLVDQWCGELERHIKPKPRVLVYHGKRVREGKNVFEIAGEYDYVVSTYHTVTRDVQMGSVSTPKPPAPPQVPTPEEEKKGAKRRKTNAKKSKAASPVEDPLPAVAAAAPSAAMEKNVSKLTVIRWARVVLDEAHHIRTGATNAARAITKIQADARWCLTGTPIQNRLRDITPLLSFIGVPVIADGGLALVGEEGVGILRQILPCVMLRRPASIVELPTRVDEIVRVTLSEEERGMTDVLHNAAVQRLGKAPPRSGVRNSVRVAVFELILRLRQAALHPQIVADALQRKRARSGSAVDTPAAQQRDPELEAFVSRLRNKSSHHMQSQSFFTQVVESVKSGELEQQECTICFEEMRVPMVLPCAHVLCEDCGKRIVSSSGQCPMCKQRVSMRDVMIAPKKKVPEPDPVATLATLDVDRAWTHSAKTTRVVDHVCEILARDPKARVIIFSQFVAYLTLLETAFNERAQSMGVLEVDNDDDDKKSSKKKKGKDNSAKSKATSSVVPATPKVLMLHGGMGRRSQTRHILRLGLGKAKENVVLASLQAVGVGLNFTWAQHCFVMEPSWNPTVEAQAIGRVHRIGQKHTTYVYRYVADKTVDERVLQYQAGKLGLANMCIEGSLEQLRDVLTWKQPGEW